MQWNLDTIRNTVLENDTVKLRRITLNDREQFARIAFDDETWQYFVASVGNDAELDRFMEEAVRDTLNGTRIVFAIIDRASGRIAGSTAFGNLVAGERKLEIGWSWLGREYRGSALNRATKRLLLDHAFECLLCERVEFKTDVLNLRARAGLKAIGAQEEGVLRSFNYMPGGRRRNAVFYSILKEEWPAVREQRLRINDR
ncbi:GNAT family N-acetyltransferase [Oxalobacteraceae bacterium]|nr:GNAT family N-acetyltransferase [Oxalobacteraceae bacterium]